MRLMSDAAIAERYGPKPNPYAEHPQTFACQQIEAGNATRELVCLLALKYVRLLRRLPFIA
jgi:hypothetical protein